MPATKITVPTKSGCIFSGYEESSSQSKIVYADGTIYKDAIHGVYQWNWNVP